MGGERDEGRPVARRPRGAEDDVGAHLGVVVPDDEVALVGLVVVAVLGRVEEDARVDLVVAVLGRIEDDRRRGLVGGRLGVGRRNGFGRGRRSGGGGRDKIGEDVGENRVDVSTVSTGDHFADAIRRELGVLTHVGDPDPDERVGDAAVDVVGDLAPDLATEIRGGAEREARVLNTKALIIF